MKSFVCIFLLLTMNSLLAIDNGIVVTRDSETLLVTDITSDADGNMACFFKNKKNIIPKTAYLYVRIAKPVEITNAEKLLNNQKYSEAEQKFNELKIQYCYSGWRVYCIWKQAEALLAIKRSDAASEIISPLINEKIIDNEQDLWKYIAAFKCLAEIYISSRQYEKGIYVLNTIASSGDVDATVYASTELGNIAMLQDDKNVAKSMYIQAVMLGDDKMSKRTEALSRLIDLLKNEKDKSFSQYSEMLNKIKQ